MHNVDLLKVHLSASELATSTPLTHFTFKHCMHVACKVLCTSNTGLLGKAKQLAAKTNEQSDFTLALTSLSCWLKFFPSTYLVFTDSQFPKHLTDDQLPQQETAAACHVQKSLQTLSDKSCNIYQCPNESYIL